uniref:Uncharacterized protein n=1 Tax=Anopheles atroparvus TaxID=41427 RepID=A0A182JMT2_ANOAO
MSANELSAAEEKLDLAAIEWDAIESGDFLEHDHLRHGVQLCGPSWPMAGPPPFPMDEELHRALTPGTMIVRVNSLQGFRCILRRYPTSSFFSVPGTLATVHNPQLLDVLVPDTPAGDVFYRKLYSDIVGFTSAELWPGCLTGPAARPSVLVLPASHPDDERLNAMEFVATPVSSPSSSTEELGFDFEDEPACGELSFDPSFEPPQPPPSPSSPPSDSAQAQCDVFLGESPLDLRALLSPPPHTPGSSPRPSSPGWYAQHDYSYYAGIPAGLPLTTHDQLSPLPTTPNTCHTPPTPGASPHATMPPGDRQHQVPFKPV